MSPPGSAINSLPEDFAGINAGPCSIAWSNFGDHIPASSSSGMFQQFSATCAVPTSDATFQIFNAKTNYSFNDHDLDDRVQ